MGDVARELLKWAPAVLVVLVILVAGARGFWYWGPTTRRVIAMMERNRREWRTLALALLREKGIDVPADELDVPHGYRDRSSDEH